MQHDSNPMLTQMAVSNASDLMRAMRQGTVKPDDKSNDGSTLRDWLIGLRDEIDRFLLGSADGKAPDERTADTIRARAERAILSVNEHAFDTVRNTQWAGFDMYVQPRNDKFDITLAHADHDPLTPRYVTAIRSLLGKDFGEIILETEIGRRVAD